MDIKNVPNNGLENRTIASSMNIPKIDITTITEINHYGGGYEILMKMNDYRGISQDKVFLDLENTDFIKGLKKGDKLLVIRDLKNNRCFAMYGPLEKDKLYSID